MKFSLTEMLLVVGICSLAIALYYNHHDLQSAKETINLQLEAIEKQNQLILLQRRHIDFLNNQAETENLSPLNRFPL